MFASDSRGLHPKKGLVGGPEEEAAAPGGDHVPASFMCNHDFSKFHKWNLSVATGERRELRDPLQGYLAHKRHRPRRNLQ